MSTSTRGRGFPLCCLATVLGLAACRTSPPPAPSQPVVAPSRLEKPVDARTLSVVAADSTLEVWVYRGGPMARMGHNHVIASRHLQGEVHLADDATRSRFDIRFPVNELTIDEPAMREAAGPDFPAEVPQGARDGTRRNLLSEALLDGANFPHIRLLATDVKPAGGQWDVGVEITFKDRVYPVRVPVRLEHSGAGIVARGQFTLNQSELGLKPFSVAMGSLVVLDEMRIRFTLVAR
jgi:polyisoprenoid-binding protein YceI